MSDATAPQPLVSVLMTAYNREKYIADAIQSVLDSTYPHFELIITDDRSVDRTYEIAEDFARSDARIRLFRNESNLGDYPNRNAAASHARGKYLKYVDADDLMYPHGLEVMVRAMERFPEAGFGLVRPQSDYVIFPLQSSPAETYREHFFEMDIFGRSPLGSIIRKDAFEALNGFVPRPFIGDVDLWYRLGARYPMVKIVPGLAHWRAHGDQQNTIESKLLKMIDVRYRISKDYLLDSACPLPSEERAKAYRLIRWEYARKILRYTRQGQLQVARQVFAMSELTLTDLLKALSRPR